MTKRDGYFQCINIFSYDKWTNTFSAHYKPSQEWNLKNMEFFRSENIFNATGEVYPLLTIDIEFERRSTFYVVNLIFPNAVITILTIVAFILPEESGIAFQYFPQ